MGSRCDAFGAVGAILLLGLTPAAAAQPYAVGSEFQINSYTEGPQRNPAVACSSAGEFVVVWDAPDSTTGEVSTIFARSFNTVGNPLGTTFEAPTEICNEKCAPAPSFYPAVCRPPHGDFVVVWERAYADGDGSGVFGHIFDENGVAKGSEFQLNTQTIGYQYGAAVACHDNGDFVAVWQQEDAGETAILGRRFGSNGAALGSEFQVNTLTTVFQAYPRVAVMPDRGFVVVWGSGSYFSSADGSASGIVGRRFDSAANPEGEPFQVNSYTPGYQDRPAIASNSAGNFVVVWQGGDFYYGQDGNYAGIFGQRFDSTGALQGSEFQVNEFTTEYQLRPSVSFDGVNGFVVVWQSGDMYGSQDGSYAGVFARPFADDGTPSGSELQVNSFTVNDQAFASVCSDDVGHLVSTWESFGQDGSDTGIFGRRYATADISGHIRYYSNGRLVPDATVDLVGTGQSIMTNSAGGFALPADGGADATLLPSKLGDENGSVTSFDAAQALRASVGLITFSEMQKLACDVTGNGTLSSFDAARILQYRVGLLTQFDVALACDSDWLFVPAPESASNQTLIDPEIMSGLCEPGGIAYSPIAPPLPHQDFIAILFGDCTGNWQP